ncbi:MAG: transcription termination/antitermination protein NusG [Kiritimatiellia bacterium]
MRQWYVINTLTSQESKVQNLIKSTAAVYVEPSAQGGDKVDLTESIGEVLIPTEKVVSTRKDGHKVSRTVKLYPGYVFIECDLYLDNRMKQLNLPLWHFINQLEGVIGLLGAERNLRGEMVRPPVPLSDQEVKNLLEMMNPEAHQARPNVSYEPGETVSIIEGPFKGNTGPIQTIDPEHGRLTVSVSIFGGETPVDLEYWQVERYLPQDGEAK